jgi:hypothetical protein
VRVRARRLRHGGGVGEEGRIEPRATIVVAEQLRRWENGSGPFAFRSARTTSANVLRTKRKPFVLTRTV